MEKVQLGEIFEYLPKSKFKAGEGKGEGKYKFFTSSNIQNKFIDEYIYDGECLIFGTGGKASINYCNEKFATSTDNFVVKVHRDFCPKLIYLYFKNDMRKLENGFKGASIKHISKEYINKLIIPKYNYEQQIRIVKELDKSQEIIDIRKKQIQELDQLIKSQFVEMFENNEWNEVNLNDVSQKITDGEHGTVPRVEKGRLYLMARNITDSSKIDLTEISYISEENHKKIYSRCNPEKDDLLLVCVGATVGKVALVPEMEEFSMARSVALIKPNKQLMNSSFLLYLMKSDYIQSQIKNCVHAAAQAGLYTNMIKDLKFKLPPIELQNQFSEFVKLIDKKKFEIQKSLEEMEKLQESLMNKYFN